MVANQHLWKCENNGHCSTVACTSWCSTFNKTCREDFFEEIACATEIKFGQNNGKKIGKRI
jgi:hypothetical protein